MKTIKTKIIDTNYCKSCPNGQSVRKIDGYCNDCPNATTLKKTRKDYAGSKSPFVRKAIEMLPKHFLASEMQNMVIYLQKTHRVAPSPFDGIRTNADYEEIEEAILNGELKWEVSGCCMISACTGLTADGFKTQEAAEEEGESMYCQVCSNWYRYSVRPYIASDRRIY